MKCRLLLLLLAGLLLAGCSCGGSTPIPATDTGSAAATVAIPAGTAPVVPAVDPGKLTVATFNLMFLGDDDTANDAAYGSFGRNVRRGTRQLVDRLAAQVAGADIIGVQEIENQAALALLCAALDRQTPGARYAGFMYDSRLPQDVALLWNSATVRGSNARQLEAQYRVVGYEGDRKVYFARVPVVADFAEHGVDFSVMVVHLKAKSTRDAAFSNARRGAECERMLAWLDDRRGRAGGEHCLILGDFNDRHTADGNRTSLDPLLQAERAGRLRFLTTGFAARRAYTSFGEYGGTAFRETIDHIIIPAALEDHYVAGSCRTTMHADPQLSDHHPVFADFRLQ